MSAIRPPRATPGASLCPRCGVPLRDEQSWCLECGLAARTRVHPPPSWRLPVVATFVALALATAGLAFALVTLLDEHQSTPAAATVTTAASPAVATPTTTPAVTPTLPGTTTPSATIPSTTTPPASSIPAVTTPPASSSPTTTPSATTPPRTYTFGHHVITLPATGR